MSTERITESIISWDEWLKKHFSPAEIAKLPAEGTCDYSILGRYYAIRAQAPTVILPGRGSVRNYDEKQMSELMDLASDAFWKNHGWAINKIKELIS